MNAHPEEIGPNRHDDPGTAGPGVEGRVVGGGAGMDGDAGTFLTWVAGAHGVFWLTGGLWALLSPGTFQAVTGPKKDYWLVRTVAGLLTVGGAVGLMSAVRRRAPQELAMTLTGGAAVLTIIDVTYVAKRRISAVYLLDALAHVLLIAGWIAGWRDRRR